MRLPSWTVLTCAVLLPACDSATEPEPPSEKRVLGIVSEARFEGEPETPRAWIVEGRTFKVEITTVGSCTVTRSDWEVVQRDGYLDDPGFAFILPYEYRSLECPSTPERTLRAYRFTDTLQLELETALEAQVRIVSGDGSVFDLHLDFHEGWPTVSPAAVKRSTSQEESHDPADP